MLNHEVVKRKQMCCCNMLLVTPEQDISAQIVLLLIAHTICHKVCKLFKYLIYKN